MNENVMTISKIEGLLCEAGKHLGKLETNNNRQDVMRRAAIEELNDLQTETIHALRLLFE